MKFPDLSSNQNAPSGLCPAGRIEARSLRATPTTLARPFEAIFISSPMVVTHKFLGDMSPASLLEPTGLTVSSSVQYTFFPFFTKLFPAMP